MGTPYANHWANRPLSKDFHAGLSKHVRKVQCEPPLPLDVLSLGLVEGTSQKQSKLSTEALVDGCGHWPGVPGLT